MIPITQWWVRRRGGKTSNIIQMDEASTEASTPTASHREKRKRFRHTKTQGSAAAKPVRMATLTSRRALWRGDERSDSQMNDRTPSQSLSPQIVGDDPAATGLDCTNASR